ncbi:MAG: hypothetical protein ACP5NZ_03455 [Nanobdellota archaeon]
MNNLEIIEDIFERTRLIIKLIKKNEENPQIVPIMNYLLVTTTYLKGREEVSKFKKNWVEISDRIKSGIDENIFREYYKAIHKNVNQGLMHNGISDNELANFYQGVFLKMYGEAKMKYPHINQNLGDKRREHCEYIFSTKERFEEALKRGDFSAICD